MNKKTAFASLLALGLLAGCSQNTPSSSSSSEESSSSISESSSESSSSRAPQALTGQGAPDNDFGQDGDTYTDLLTNDRYQKKNGEWVRISSKSYTGKGAPEASLGQDGDVYLDTTTTETYTKSDGTWHLDCKKYSVSFSVGDGSLPSGVTEIPTQYVEEGKWATEPSIIPERTSSVFIGWYDGEFKYNFHTGVYGNLVLVAKFQVNESEKVTITVNPANGSPEYDVETYDGAYITLKTPYKEGFTFKGWYVDGDTSDRFTGVVDSTLNGHTIVALYEEAHFNFRFVKDANNEITITGLIDIETTIVVVPSYIGGYPVTKIGKEAFASRIYIEEIYLPETIKEIAPNAFVGAYRVTSIFVDEANTHYLSDNGILYNKTKTEVCYVPSKNCETYSCPATLKKIGDYAFYSFADMGISSITFNEGLEEIGERAFYGNENISNIKFPSSLKKIGKAAFETLGGYGAITTIIWNDGLEEIGEAAFTGQYMSDALTIPSSVKKIGAYAFGNCTAITEVRLPAALEEYDSTAFNGATGVFTVTLPASNPNFKVVDNILLNKEGTKTLYCPSNVYGDDDGILTIPEGVTEIGAYSFYMVDEVRSYNFPSTLTKIGAHAFDQCYHMKSIVIPDSVTELGVSAFDVCSDLSSVTLGAGLTKLPKYAFGNASKLRSIEIPSNIVTIDEDAFYGNGLQSITFHEGLQEIGASAFYFCSSSDEEDYTTPTAYLEELYLPNSLKKIGKSAFNGQSALSFVEIGAGLEEIGESAFGGTKVNDLALKEGSELIFDGKVLYTPDYKKAIFALSELTGTLTIHSGCEEIGASVFRGQNKLSAIKFPSTLVKIGDEAFASAFKYSALPAVTFPASLRTIGMGAFSLSNVGSVTFQEGLETIEEGAFFGSEITSLDLPNSLKTIGDYSFKLLKLSHLNLGTGVEYIGEEAFLQYRVYNLHEAITIPASVKEIKPGAFAGTAFTITDFAVDEANVNYTSSHGVVYTKDMTKVVMIAGNYGEETLNVASTVTEILPHGLGYSQSLRKIVLPNGLKTIGTYGFAADAYLTSPLYIPESVEFVGERAFSSWKKGQEVHFACTQDYALMTFEAYYDSDSQATFSYGQAA